MEEIIGTEFNLYSSAPFPFSKVISALKRYGFDIKSIPNIQYKLPINYVSLNTYKSFLMSTGSDETELRAFLDYKDPERFFKNTISFSYEYDFSDPKNVRTLFNRTDEQINLALKLKRISSYLTKQYLSHNGSAFHVKKVVSSFDFDMLDFGVFSTLKNKGEFIIVTFVKDGHYGYNLNIIFEIKDNTPISIAYHETLSIYKVSLNNIMKNNFPADECFEHSLEILDMLSV